jgi:putative ABC transport system permease protein
MFLAFRELAFARGRFTLMGFVIAMIAILVVLLSGLSAGLVNDGVSGLQRLPVTSFAFEEGVAKAAAFSRSVVNSATADGWREQPDVAAVALFGNTLVNGRSDRGTEVDLALFGVETGSFIDPDVAVGDRLAAEGDVVISPTAAVEGIAVGDTIRLEPTGTQLRVVGIMSDQHTFGHVDVGYVPLRTWQEVRSGIRAGEVVPEHVYQEVTAIAVRAAEGRTVDLAAGDAAIGTTSMTLEASFGASPGYTAETSTLMLIQGFLFAISALVVGAFFTVLTVQRTPEIAVLRALGAGTRYLLTDSITQSLVLLVVSTTIGVLLGLAVGAMVSSTAIPFALSAGPILGASVLLVTLGLLGAVVAVLRIARIDPLTALGDHR